MQKIADILTNTNPETTHFNWLVVGTLLFLTGVAGIPAVFLVAMVAIGPDIFGGESSIINPLHFETPAVIFVHGGSGILFFLTMPFQFSPKLRNKNLRRHKVTGRIAITSAFVMAISGVWMHNLLSPESQGTRYILLILTSFAICLAFSIALWHILKRNVQAHQKWMARAVAITLAAVTPLFTELLIVFLFSHSDSIFPLLNQFHYDYGRLLGVAINLSIVEIIFATRMKKHSV